jgi:uncharacterized membrane protein YeaQ/YmgE (transglycosylase-associated protein family)
MDAVMGVAGALAGGFLFSAAHLVVRGVMIYTNLAAILGAAILTGAFQYFAGEREYSSTS